jgi:hypothetical protein
MVRVAPHSLMLQRLCMITPTHAPSYSKLREAYGKYRSFDLGTIESLASLFALVESNKHSLNITEYSVSQSSFEQVFLHFAKKQAEEVNV